MTTIRIKLTVDPPIWSANFGDAAQTRKQAVREARLHALRLLENDPAFAAAGVKVSAR